MSVRTLRHYDDIGLLRPTEVDPGSGYRRYSPEALHRLHRILVLRDLGVPLAEIGPLLDQDVSLEQLRGILRLRQAEAQAELAARHGQLARVQARLAQLEDAVADYDVVVKSVDAVRIAALGEDLADHQEIGAAAARLYPRLHAALDRHGMAFTGLSYACYQESDSPQRPIRFTAGLPLEAGDVIAEDDVRTVELPPVRRAATTVVAGPPSRFPDAFTALFAWAERTGERPSGLEREVYLDCDGPPETWVTELQVILHDVAPSGRPGGADPA